MMLNPWLNLSKEELASTPTSAQKTVSFTKQIICSGRHSTDISRSGKMFDVLFFREHITEMMLNLKSLDDYDRLTL
jgi:hypothetical protein